MFNAQKNSQQRASPADPEEFRDSPKMPVVVVLDNIPQRHNIGSAFRTSDAFALEQICLCGITSCPPSPEIHKSALGAETQWRGRIMKTPWMPYAHYKRTGIMYGLWNRPKEPSTWKFPSG